MRTESPNSRSMYENESISNRRDGHEKTYQHTCGFEKTAAETGDGVFGVDPVACCFGDRINRDGLRTRWRRWGDGSRTEYRQRLRGANRVPGGWARHCLDSKHGGT